MDSYVSISPRLHVAVVTFAARHSTSVEHIVSEAVAAYLADVECGLLLPPRPAPRWELRSVARGGK